MLSPPQLTYADLSSWLQGLLSTAGTLAASGFPIFNQGPYIPEMPDELCSITLTGGTGYQLEGAADAPTFQVRVRSAQNHQETAANNAQLLDKLIFEFSPSPPLVLPSGMKLLLVSRVGGGPASIGPPDDAFRFDYVCNYYAIVGAA